MSRPPYRPRRGEIPLDPGVYRFLDENGRVLYVGKAKSLRSRLSGYFGPPETLPERTRHMVAAASDVQWTIVRSEKEALHLEYSWIQEFSPPFNVRFKDDKSYPFLVVTLAEEAPRVMVSRNRRIRGARYFGPYPKVWAVNEAIDQLIRVFPIRTCNDGEYRRAMAAGRPCFKSQIGRCGGPCSQRVSIERHREAVEEFVRFMETFDRSFVTQLEERMRRAAAELRFEEAARLRDRVAALENVLERSAVVLPEGTELDLFAIAEDELAASVQYFRVRGGRVRGVRGWVADKELEVAAPELVQQALQRVYGEGERPPAQIVVPLAPEDPEALEEWLAERRGGRVRISAARRGPRAELLETARINAVEALGQYKLRRTADYAARSDALGEVQTALGMAQAPLRIECFDVSHLHGRGVVASMVVFEDGLPRTAKYRRFNIAAARDDTDAMHQAVSRRLARLGEGTPDPSASREEGAPSAQKASSFSYPPQLLLVDGGRPQVAAAARALAESGAQGIALAGLAKRLEELWLPEDPFPVVLPRGSEALFLLQRIRDEAHRFALRAQRQTRKQDVSTVLAEVPGLGPARIRALLRRFGSLARLRTAGPEELCEVPGIGPSTAEAIMARLHAADG